MSLLQDALRDLQKGEAAPIAAASARATPALQAPARRAARYLAVAAVALVAASAVVWAMGARRTAPSASPPVSAIAASEAPPRAAPIEPSSATAGGSAARPVPSPLVEREPSRPEVPAGRSRASNRVDRKSSAARAAPVPSTAPPAPQPGASRAETLATFNQGSRALAAGDWKVAEVSFRRLVDEDPQVVEGWNNLGIALVRQGKVDAARGAFERALAVDPGYPSALQNAGLLLLVNDGKPTEAAELFRRAAAADPDAAAPRVNLAIALARSGRVAEALGALVAARRRFPRDPDLLYQLGTISERAGDQERAVEAYGAFLAAAHGARPDREQAVRGRLEAWGKTR